VHSLLEHSNRGKKSIALDLATDEGREVLYKLAEVSDVFLTNKLPRVRKDLLIDVEHIRERNPRIVDVRGSGYGPMGPDADRGGYDILGYWSRSGVGGAVQVPGDMLGYDWEAVIDLKVKGAVGWPSRTLGAVADLLAALGDRLGEPLAVACQRFALSVAVSTPPPR
jgi:crotonobetainyl-CoA:carnitine CoA-transferase CaiB-like acyl-CoA transferase